MHAHIALAAGIVAVIIVLLVGARRLARAVGIADKFYTLNDTISVQSSVDGMRYRVHADHANPAAAADVLAHTNAALTRLMRHLKKKYSAAGAASASAYPARTAAVRALLKRYNPDNLAENSPLDPAGDTSYTLDKGALIALCLRERDPKLKKCLRGGCSGVDPRTMKLHDEAITTFVAIHELAHVAINDVDHPPRFWATFKFLLQEADECGVLAAKDARFDLRPTMYCGLRVDYVPTQDPGVAEIH